MLMAFAKKNAPSIHANCVLKKTAVLYSRMNGISNWSVREMTLDEWISQFNNGKTDKLAQSEQIEIRDMLIELLKYRVKFGGATVKEIVTYLDIHQAECEESDKNGKAP